MLVRSLIIAVVAALGLHPFIATAQDLMAFTAPRAPSAPAERAKPPMRRVALSPNPIAPIPGARLPEVAANGSKRERIVRDICIGC